MNKTQIILYLAFTLTFSCFCNAQISLNNYSNLIIGTWEEEEDSEYSLVFSSNGNCSEYSENELLSTYTYSIEDSNCDNYTALNTTYLKLIDLDDSQITCFEILNIEEEVLSLLIIDKANRLFFIRQ